MDDEFLERLYRFDPIFELALSKEVIFQYEVLLASIRSNLQSGLFTLIVLMVLMCATVGITVLYNSLTLWQLLPSIIVILLFALVSYGRYVMRLLAIRSEAFVALDYQYAAHKKVENGTNSKE